MSTRIRRALWCLPLVLAAGLAVAQGYQPNFIRNLVGPIAITGNVSGTGTATFTGDATASHFVATATSGTQHACTGAAACAFASASGQSATLDCGGGTCTASVGAANATTTVVGRSGQTTTINGTTTVGGAFSTGSNNITTTGRYCTDVACTTAYIVNDTFGTMNLVGSVGGSGNWSTAGSINTDDYLKMGATAVSGGSACSAGNEGKMRRDTAAGGTSGARTRICICTSDGAGSPAYAWQNIVSGTVGTTTACNP